MNKKNLDQQLNKWIEELPRGNREFLLKHLNGLQSVYPFNEYEYRLMFLLDKNIITFPEYEDLRNAYIKANPYLILYGMSPRVFGEIWAQQHLIELDNKFQKPSKDIDKRYSGDYDLYLKNKIKIIKVEVKASRAINTKIRGGLEAKALSFASKEPYWMNFQQIKLNMADVFIFIGVWVDKLCYWVLTNKEIKRHPMISHQHRGGIEYQIGITEKNIKQFHKFLVKPNQLVDIIKAQINNHK